MRRCALLLRGGAMLSAALDNPKLVGASYIDGQFVPAAPGAKTIEVRNPATDEVIGVVPNHGKAETDAAIAAAAHAQTKWADTVAQKRAEHLRHWRDLMHKNAKHLGKLLTLEAGKPLAEAVGENTYSANFVDWYAGEAERIYGDIIPSPRHGVRTIVQKQPVGVVGVVTPWNFPSAMCTRTVAGALAAGCSVVLKPSELTPFSAIALAELAEEAGIPKGVFNVVIGEPAPIGDAMMASDVVRKFSFTGSTRVGKHLLAQCAQTVKKAAMELGGNAPFIVFGDADLDLAAQQLIIAKFRNAGQTCVCANRVFVHESVHDAFVEKFVAAVKTSLKVGNGLHEGVTMGPLINRPAVDRVEKLVVDAVAGGAKVVLGGKRIAGPGYFFEPTVLTNVTHDMDVCQSEIFGPVAPIVKFRADDEVLALANGTKAGLASYFFTTDYRRQWSLTDKLKFGMAGVNTGIISAPCAPFGGMKESGLGRDGSKYGVEAFLDIKYAAVAI